MSVRPHARTVREALDLEHATGLRLGDAGVPGLRALPSGELVGEGAEHVAPAMIATFAEGATTRATSLGRVRTNCR